MIQVRGLGVQYGSETALKGIDLSISKNTTCAIIGPSGCGKTTLLYALAGLLPPNEGQIFINGENLKGIRKSTGIIHQNTGLLPWKTAWENVTLGLKARKMDREAIEYKTNAILKELDMLAHKSKYPAQLSGGQKQRVAIARTLVLEPDLLLLDEASSALDAITKEHIQDLVLKMYKKDPITLVIVTHSIEEAVFLGQKIVIMDKATIRDVIENPYFGVGNIRMKTEYYSTCLEVRKQLNEGTDL